MLNHQYAYNGSAGLALATAVLAQVGIAPWLPLIITIINGIFALLQNKQAKKAKAKAAAPTVPPVEETQPLPQPAELTGHDIEPAE